jgi:hypothetical protein
MKEKTMADLSAEQWWGTETRTVALQTALNVRRKDPSVDALLADAAKIEAWLCRPKTPSDAV